MRVRKHPTPKLPRFAITISLLSFLQRINAQLDTSSRRPRRFPTCTDTSSQSHTIAAQKQRSNSSLSTSAAIFAFRLESASSQWPEIALLHSVVRLPAAFQQQKQQTKTESKKNRSIRVETNQQPSGSAQHKIRLNSSDVTTKLKHSFACTTGRRGSDVYTKHGRKTRVCLLVLLLLPA